MEAKRKRLQGQVRKAEEQQKAAVAASKAEVKKKRCEEKDAADNATLLRRSRTGDMSAHLRRSDCWCNCACPSHWDVWLRRDGCHSVLWLGVDTSI